VDKRKYDLTSPTEQDMMRMLFVEGKSTSQVRTALHDKGIEKSHKSIVTFKKTAIENLIEMDRAEYMADYLLESNKRAQIEFNDIVESTKKLLKQAQEDNKPNFQLDLLRELRAQVETALKIQGKMNSSITQSILNIQNNNTTTSDIMDQMEKIKISWFTNSNAELNPKGQIVFVNPTGEMIDLFKKWKFSNEFSKAKVVDMV